VGVTVSEGVVGALLADDEVVLLHWRRRCCLESSPVKLLPQDWGPPSRPVNGVSAERILPLQFPARLMM